MRLIVENLAFGPGGLLLARDLSFELNAGEVLHVVGENGSGKSFLARVLLGIDPARGGRVELETNGTRYLPQAQNRGSHLPYSLGEVLALEGAPTISLLEKEKEKLAWNKASGGERQRVLLSRFFSAAGDFLVLDEPFNHLDLATKEKVRELLRSTLNNNPSAGALLISHEDNPATWLGSIPVRALRLSGEAT